MQVIPDSLAALLASLQITSDLLAQKNLPPHAVADEVIVAETNAQGVAFYLTPDATRAWHALKQAAANDGVAIEIVSSFRTLEHQADIIRRKLAQGLDIATILTLSAPPGYSEHHSGCAIDINTPGCIPTEECFADTPAYAWLEKHAGQFGFILSYPRNNALGFIYEPWHWHFQSGSLQGTAA